MANLECDEYTVDQAVDRFRYDPISLCEGLLDRHFLVYGNLFKLILGPRT